MTQRANASSPGPASRPSSPAWVAWLAPSALVLTLLTGAILHFRPDADPTRRTGSAHTRPATPSHTASAPVPAAPALVITSSKPAEKPIYYPARNTRVAGSERCRDCEFFYSVYDGRGGKIRRSDGYTTRCCTCGTVSTFSDGYAYEIICEADRIRAKLVPRSRE